MCMSRGVEYPNIKSAFSQHDSSTEVTALLVAHFNQQKDEHHQGRVKASNLGGKCLTIYVA